MQSSVLALFGLIISFSVAAPAATWKSVFVSGDHSIPNFDNGREDVASLLGSLGRTSQVHLTSEPSKVNASKNVFLATGENLGKALPNILVESGEACLIYMTSHGAKNQGFYLSRAGILPPAQLASLVNRRCGNSPTIILISACYSGQFITEALKGPNRVILTAAIADRPSFGCSADTRYTFWDNCLLEEIPRSSTWTGVAQNVATCIQKREAALGANSSFPQSWIGDLAKSWPKLL